MLSYFQLLAQCLKEHSGEIEVTLKRSLEALHLALVYNLK